MPATEQTWRDQKTLHFIFGASALVMLLTTIWMMADDHTREWKDIQKTQARVDTWTVRGRIHEQATTQYRDKLGELEVESALAKGEPIDPLALDRFKAEVEKDAEARGESPPDFAALDAARENLAALAQAADAARAEAEKALAEEQRALSVAAQAEQASSPDAEGLRQAAAEATARADEAVRTKREAEKAAAAARAEVVTMLEDLIRRAKFREDNLARKKKFKAADQTALLSVLGIAIGNNRPQAEIDRLQAQADKIAEKLDGLNAQLNAATDHRKALEQILKGKPGENTPAGITYRQDKAEKALTEAQGDLKRLHENLTETSPNVGKWILRMPVVDAFDNSDLKIDQIWLPDLTINYNFSDVARFDRCTTCHRAIDKTQPGSPVEPAYRHELPPFTIYLPTPEHEPQPVYDEDGDLDRNEQLRQAYGLRLAEQGLIDRDDTVVEVVWPETPAADAGLQMGDVIEEIDDSRLLNREQAIGSLLAAPIWGKPLKLTIRRGLPHPYASHPRLDLFLGSLSPHKLGEMGCTVCHDGQGSGTEFKWASHTPNDPEQADQWRRDHGWFDNHHWIFPMYPRRFAQSTCLKCHHEVTELEPSERFPDPPAPKLVAGYHLIEKFGCFGCHEINGYDGPHKRIGPDLRTEQNVWAAALAILDDLGLSDQERAWAQQLVDQPDNTESRHRLREAIVRDKQASSSKQEQPRLTAATHKLADLLKDSETPGQLRKVGPSLRHLNSKVSFDFVYDWVRKPSDFRPTTRMPQFFGQWEHLEPPTRPLEEGEKNGLQEAQRFEPIEIRGITEYLLTASQKFQSIEPAAGATEPASAERGKVLFQLRGCLACHSHKDFPEIHSDQGPDLSRLGGKLTGEKGARWLYSWLKQPSHYSPRTKMPNLFLDLIRDQDGRVTDPVADISAYLLGGEPWHPEDVPARRLSEPERKALYDLALLHLQKQFPAYRAEDYLAHGIPESMADQVKGDETALLGRTDRPEEMVAKQLQYVGRRSISKYGCFGCHDIPGYEDAKPIGTGLADWGRKDPSRLAFELIGQFLSLPDGGASAGGAHHGAAGQEEHPGESAGDAAAGGAVPGAASHAASHFGPGLSEADRESLDVRYFLTAIGQHNRQGFLWQKLRQPRSYDYQKTENKDYNDRLRMPRFPLTAEQREEIMTFVLGLVSEPPAAQFVYHPDARNEAIYQGRDILEKYNCGGCHKLQMQRWDFDYHEQEYDAPTPLVDFPFLDVHFTREAIEGSLATDRRGLRHAVVHGEPTLDEETGQPLMFNEEQDPITPSEASAAKEIYYSFTLWKPALINGQPRLVGSPNLLVRDSGTVRYPGRGGTLADYLFPVVIAREKEINPQAKGSEAWGWLPPPLVGEGKKVQTKWLHDFLLDPYRIRPAVVLRMPKFNMSSDEATRLADYFAAVDDAEYPYLYDERTRESRLEAINRERPGYLADALKIVLDNNYCVKCHKVGDFVPQGRAVALAPDLARVHDRLRPTFMRNWIANPKRILPYTGMPVNIPYKPDQPHLGGISQEIFPGTSIEQLDAVVDFLLNFNRYVQEQVSISKQVKPAAPAAAGAEKKAAGAAGAADEQAAGAVSRAVPPTEQFSPSGTAAPRTVEPATTEEALP